MSLMIKVVRCRSSTTAPHPRLILIPLVSIWPLPARTPMDSLLIKQSALLLVLDLDRSLFWRLEIYLLLFSLLLRLENLGWLSVMPPVYPAYVPAHLL